MEVTFTSSADAVTRRRADMLATLAAKDAEREARKTARSSARPVETATPASFWASFNADATEIKAELGRAAASSAAAETLRAELDALNSRIAGVQALLNECTRFLPQFDVRKAQTGIDALLAELDDVRARLAPRKKFAFSKRPAATPAAAAAPVTPATPSDDATPSPAVKPTGAGGAGGSTASVDEKNPFVLKAREESTGGGHRWEEDEYTVSGLAGQYVHIPLGEFTRPADADSAAGGEGDAPRLQLSRAKDFRVMECEQSLICISDITRAIRIDKLSNCIVLCGPTAGSVLLHECKNCIFFIASRQIRIHSSTDCAFAVSAMSRPIIEHCTGLSFLPYCLDFPGLGHALSVASVGRPVDANLWRSVDDFGWHRVQKSPNWRELPPAHWPRDLAALPSLTRPDAYTAHVFAHHLAADGAAVMDSDAAQRFAQPPHGMTLKWDTPWAARALAAAHEAPAAVPLVAAPVVVPAESAGDVAPVTAVSVAAPPPPPSASEAPRAALPPSSAAASSPIASLTPAPASESRVEVERGASGKGCSSQSVSAAAAAPPIAQPLSALPPATHATPAALPLPASTPLDASAVQPLLQQVAPPAAARSVPQVILSSALTPAAPVDEDDEL